LSDNFAKSVKSKGMEIRSAHQVPLSADRLWQAITDPVILQNCLNSCYEVNRSEDGEYFAFFNIKLGPATRHYSAQLKIVDSAGIDNYRLEVSVEGDLSASAQAIADVRLESIDDQSARISYSAEVIVHGWIDRFPSRLIKHFAKKQISRFFERVSEQAAKDQ